TDGPDVRAGPRRQAAARAALRADLGLRRCLPPRLDAVRGAGVCRRGGSGAAGGAVDVADEPRSAPGRGRAGPGRPLPTLAPQACLLVQVPNPLTVHHDILARGLRRHLAYGDRAWRLLPRLLLAAVRHPLPARHDERAGYRRDPPAALCR